MVIGLQISLATIVANGDRRATEMERKERKAQRRAVNRELAT